ncbi:hypothetical protein CLOM_g6640 [Closterium sp. NIES-68]|nr:hypothetical protein CLOM_g6640 [Closterium sp. NIES-68]
MHPRSNAGELPRTLRGGGNSHRRRMARLGKAGRASFRRVEKAIREGCGRFQKAVAVACIETARAAERVRCVASTFLSSAGLKRARRRRSAAASSAVPRVFPAVAAPPASPGAYCANHHPPPPAAASSSERIWRTRLRGLPNPFPAARSETKPFRWRFSFRQGSASRGKRGQKAPWLRTPPFSSGTSSGAPAACCAASSSAAASSAAASSAACSSTPVAPLDDSSSVASSASSAASASPAASSANSAGANQPASSTSPTVSTCSSLAKNASSPSPYAPPSLYPANSTSADLRADRAPAAASSFSSPPHAPRASVEAASLGQSHADAHAASFADCHAVNHAEAHATRSSSWKRAMSIAIPACDGGDEAQGAGEEVGEETREKAGKGGDKRAEPVAGEAAEDAEMAEWNGGRSDADSAVDIDLLWEAAAEAELQAEEHAATAAAAAAAGGKRWRGMRKAVTPRSIVVTPPRSDVVVTPRSTETPRSAKTLRSDFPTATQGAQTSQLTPRGFALDSKMGWGALAESAERAERAGGSNGNNVSPAAASPRPPTTPRFFSALRASFRRSAPDAATVVVAGSNPSSATPVLTITATSVDPGQNLAANPAREVASPTGNTPYEHHRDTVGCSNVHCRRSTCTILSTPHNSLASSKSAEGNATGSISNRYFSDSVSSSTISSPSITPSLRVRRGLTPLENPGTEKRKPRQARQLKLQAQNGASAPDFRAFELAQASSSQRSSMVPELLSSPSLRSHVAHDLSSSSNVHSSSKAPELSWDQLSAFAAGKLERGRPGINGGQGMGVVEWSVVEGGMAEGRVVERGGVEWGVVEGDAEDYLDSPAVVPARSCCGFGRYPAQQDRQQLWHSQQQEKAWQKQQQQQQQQQGQQEEEDREQQGQEAAAEEEEEQEWFQVEKQPGCAAAVMCCVPFSVSRRSGGPSCSGRNPSRRSESSNRQPSSRSEGRSRQLHKSHSFNNLQVCVHHSSNTRQFSRSNSSSSNNSNSSVSSSNWLLARTEHTSDSESVQGISGALCCVPFSVSRTGRKTDASSADSKARPSGPATPRGAGSGRLERAGSGGAATVVRYVPRFARHRQQSSVVRGLARGMVGDLVGVKVTGEAVMP